MAEHQGARCDDKSDQNRSPDPGPKLAAGDQREDAQYRDGIGHQPMDEPEPHGFAPLDTEEFGRARASSAALGNVALPMAPTSTASISARKRKMRSAPTLRSARTRSPALVTMVTPSPLFR